MKGEAGRIIEEIILCDSEEEYVKRLAERLSLKKEIAAEVRICSSPESLEQLPETGKKRVLLIGEEYPYESRKEAQAGLRIVLTRNHCRDLGEEEEEVRKYQSADKLITEILVCIGKGNHFMSYAGTGNAALVAVYSPVHRIGKTTFAMKLGKYLAERENVLYLNLEGYAGFGGLFGNEDEKDLSHLLYYARQEHDNLGVRIASMVRQFGELDYIPPMKVWTDLQSVSTADWQHFFGRLVRDSIYSVIILDLGNEVSDIFGLLRCCDLILMPGTNDIVSEAKMAQYRYLLKVLKCQELEIRTLHIDAGEDIRIQVQEAAEELNKRREKRRSYAPVGSTS